MGIIDYEYLPTKKLSSGQRRRVALARLLITQACLWILDEPFTSLDDSGREILKSKIENHIIYGGMIIVVTHDPILISEHHIKRLQL